MTQIIEVVNEPEEPPSADKDNPHMVIYANLNHAYSVWLRMHL